MKGDFSRQTFDRTKHYAGVLMQQGRVQVDADWNEQQAISQYRKDTQVGDVIGASGGPSDAAAFEIFTDAARLDAQDREHLKSLFGSLPPEQQPVDLSGATPSFALKQAGNFFLSRGRYYVDGILCENDNVAIFTQQPDLPNGQPIQETGFNVVYLDVWLRHLTALDDPLIRETSLGGPDTTTRAKVVWQAKVQKVTTNELAPNCDSPFPEWDAVIAPSSGTLNARAQPAVTTDSTENLLLPPGAGYQRLENQLYRVEIHNGGNPGTKTFKWSRDNGSVVTAIEDVSGSDVIVHDVGRDEVLGFFPNQWVEIVDDSTELGGNPRQLIQIDTVDESNRTITLKTAPFVPLGSHPKLRRWDQFGATAREDGVKVVPGSFQAIEDGIEIEFSEGTYKIGDYWLIPARTATGEIEWPPFQIPNKNPIAQSPIGIQHHYSRLAFVNFDGTTFSSVNDCRKLFPQLTKIAAGSGPEAALHVAEINWQNDELVDPKKFFDSLNPSKLVVTLDAEPDPASINERTMIVTLETIVEMTLGAISVPVQLSLILHGLIETKGKLIQWELSGESANKIRSLFDKPNPPSACVRVILKGHAISSLNGQLHLDGQALGKIDAATSSIGLVLPSISGAHASDFESWFRLGTLPKLISLELKPNPVKAPGTATGTLRLSGKVSSEVNVDFSKEGDGAALAIIALPVSIPKNQDGVKFNVKTRGGFEGGGGAFVKITATIAATSSTAASSVADTLEIEIDR